MANTLSTYSQRHKYFTSNLGVALRAALVAEAICNVDNSDLKTIENPYIQTGTATIQAVAGTYSPSNRTVTDDALSVDDEVINSAHVFDFEARTSNFDLTANMLEQLMYETAFKVDQFVLNKILDQANGAYTTPAGGFSTPSNIPVIVGNLLSKVMGYQTGVLGSGPVLVLENTDIVGFVQAQVASGFAYADAALNNGFATNYAGVKIYVVRTGTFVTATLGTLSAVNSGHRLFGISKVATYASPRGTTYEEKSVSGKTGKELMVQALIGAKLWAIKYDLFVDITLG